MTMTIPDKIHGHKILAVRDRLKGDGTYVILGHNPGDYLPFVTAVWHPRDGANGWFWGHYFGGEDDARKDFADR
jgi:hypothetical protein